MCFCFIVDVCFETYTFVVAVIKKYFLTFISVVSEMHNFVSETRGFITIGRCGVIYSIRMKDTKITIIIHWLEMVNELPHGKTNNLRRRKQRRRSASR